MKTIKFSIVIDNYNYAEFVAESIESCLRQSYAVHEIIVVDDGSTDNSREVLDGYRDHPRIKLVFQHNQGQAAALQHGIDLAEGDWIFGLDADDYYHEDCLAEVAAAIEPGVEWVYFRTDMVDHRKVKLGVRPSQESILWKGEIWKEWMLKGRPHTFPPQSFHCYTAEFLKRVRIYPNPVVDLSKALAPDRYINMIAAVRCQAVGIEKALGCYRIHQRGDSQQAKTSISRIQRKIEQQLIAEGVAKELCAQKGITLSPHFVFGWPFEYWPERMISYICARESHSFKGDNRARLLRRILGLYFPWNHRSKSWPAFFKAFGKYTLIAVAPKSWAWELYYNGGNRLRTLSSRAKQSEKHLKVAA